MKPDANQTVNAILGLGGDAFKWVFDMYDKCCTLVYQPREEGHEEGAPPSVASCGSDGSAHLLQQVAPGDEEGPQQATWDIFIVNCWFKGAEVGRARRGGRQCV